MSDTAVATGTIQTRIPGRLDRLPWSTFHWRVLIGLGTVWILDGLEVTMVGTVASRLTEDGSGIAMTAGDIGIAGAIYIVGACIGALFFGHMTDRFGRKKLFMLTLGIYIAATFATAFSFAPWWFFLARFVTGAGIGGEYAAINSAIDELIPARVRGRVDLVINGTYWAGSAAGSALALIFLNENWIPGWLGWRLAFGIGVFLGFVILVVRRHVPESPRWLFIHGRQEDAERIVDEIEKNVESETGVELEAVDEKLTVRQRKVIPFRTIAHTAFKLYPKRAVLGIALFVGQAFIYNGITFNLGTLFSDFYDVSSSFVPVFIIIYALGNLLGPVTLGRLFDTVGRKPMISGTYLGSAVVTIPLGLVFLNKAGNEWLLIALIVVTFYLASAGASAAYLTVSEIFPMETRALAIAFFYAVGTAVGGIVGPLLFGQMIDSGSRGLVTFAFFIGAAVMAIGGIFELIFGVKAERSSLESIAQPLTVAEAEDGELPGQGGSGDSGSGDSGSADAGSAEAGSRGSGSSGGTDAPDDADTSDAMAHARRRALECRRDAEEARASAARHRADQVRAAGHSTEALERRDAAERMSGIDELRARELDEQAAAFDELAAGQQRGSLERAEAAEQRARAFAEQAAALSAADEQEAEIHRCRAEAAMARSRSREQLSRAVIAEAGEPGGSPGGEATDRPTPAPLAAAQAELHRAWSDCHEMRAAMFDAQAEGNDALRNDLAEQAAECERIALAAEQQADAVSHHIAAEQWDADIERTERSRAAQQRSAADAAKRAAAEAQRTERIRRRIAARHANSAAPRPGPSATLRPLWAGGPASERSSEVALDREIEMICSALGEHGATERTELASLVGARYWGPGRFGAALDTALDESRIRRVSKRVFAPQHSSDAQERDAPESG